MKELTVAFLIISTFLGCGEKKQSLSVKGSCRVGHPALFYDVPDSAGLKANSADSNVTRWSWAR